MKKIVISLSIIAAAAAIAVGATTAYFSDTEVSSGNTFTAGSIDLLIDSTCHYDGMVCTNDVWVEEYTGSSTYPELLGQSCSCTWIEPKNLAAGDVFFNFNDVKPGDNGENTISIHVNDNDAWVCAAVSNVVNNDNACNEPESVDDQTCGDPGTGDGELQDYLLFTIWADNGDGLYNCNNVLDPGEIVLVQNETLEEGVWPLYDSTTGYGPLPGDTTTCLGVAWSIDPLTGNIIQTDDVVGDVTFTVEQSRNNGDFTCID